VPAAARRRVFCRGVNGPLHSFSAAPEQSAARLRLPAGLVRAAWFRVKAEGLADFTSIISLLFGPRCLVFWNRMTRTVGLTRRDDERDGRGPIAAKPPPE